MKTSAGNLATCFCQLYIIFWSEYHFSKWLWLAIKNNCVFFFFFCPRGGKEGETIWWLLVMLYIFYLGKSWCTVSIRLQIKVCLFWKFWSDKDRGSVIFVTIFVRGKWLEEDLPLAFECTLSHRRWHLNCRNAWLKTFKIDLGFVFVKHNSLHLYSF